MRSVCSQPVWQVSWSACLQRKRRATRNRNPCPQPPHPRPLIDAAPAPANAPVDDCNAATLAQTISSVTTSLSDYFAAHPDANQALIDITRQSAFVAVGQVDGYFAEHPQQADEIGPSTRP